MKMKGRKPRGEVAFQARLTKRQVHEIVRKLKKTKQTLEQLGDDYGVTSACIDAINRGRSWRHITGLSKGHRAREPKRSNV